MPIRYITTGDEKAARSLLGEGRHQLSILKNAMSFQNLQQLQRVVRFDDGTAIRCTSTFGQDRIEVFVPLELPVKKKREIISEVYCWCTNWFAIGKVLEALEDYGNAGTYDASKGQIYPDHCNSSDVAIKNYNGIRYKVKICQKDKTKTYVCLSSDFAEYEVDEKVIVFMRGIWSETNLIEPTRTVGRGCKNSEWVTCKACNGTIRPDISEDEIENSADGSYLIVPLGIVSVN
jgi:hypothetical protein